MKRELLKKMLPALLLSALLSSCVVYHPHMAGLPLLHEQGEMQVEGSISVAAPIILIPAANASFAYAPTSFLGTQAAVSFTDPNTLYGQLQAGVFKTFDRAVLEWYLGYGYGTSYSGSNKTIDDHTYYVDGRYQVPYTQLNFGWNDLAQGAIDVGFGLKGGVLQPDWHKIEQYTDGSEAIAESHTDAHALLEPQLMARFGSQRLKFTLRVAYSYVWDWPTDNGYFNYERLSVGLGACYRF